MRLIAMDTMYAAALSPCAHPEADYRLSRAVP